MTNLNLVESEPGGTTNKGVEGSPDLWEVEVRAILVFVDHHGDNLSKVVAEALRASIGLWIPSAVVRFVPTTDPISSLGELGKKKGRYPTVGKRDVSRLKYTGSRRCQQLVPAAVTSAAETLRTTAWPPKLSLHASMHGFPRMVTTSGPNCS